MALPKLETPTYELTLPSNNRKITYRPFLVKEHKIMMTLADVDAKELSRVVLELIDACTFKKLNVKTLSNFDIEYIFLNLRAKSIGEIVSLKVNCECGEKIPHDINLNELVIERDENITNNVKLRHEIVVSLRYPNFYEMLDLLTNRDETNIFKVVSKCIDKIFSGEDVINRDSFTDEEAEDFLSQFTKEEFSKVEDFFIKLPKVVQKITAHCEKCDKPVETRLEGLQNFFRITLSCDDLANYYQLNFSLMQHHKYSLTELENMIPWEREIYVELLIQHIKNETEKLNMKTQNQKHFNG